MCPNSGGNVIRSRSFLYMAPSVGPEMRRSACCRAKFGLSGFCNRESLTPQNLGPPGVQVVSYALAESAKTQGPSEASPQRLKCS